MSVRFCLTCRAKLCTTCQRRGGTHHPQCPVGAGRARGELPYVGVVTETDLLEVYRAKWATAVRVGRRICGADAEDAVQNAWLYLWRRRDTLPVLTPGTFVHTVQQRAVARARSAWNRRAVRPGPEALDLIERHRGRRHTAEAWA